MPQATAFVQLDGATATIYAYATEADALGATSAFVAGEQGAPDSVRFQRKGQNVYVARAPASGKLPAMDLDEERIDADVVFTSDEEH